MVGKNEKLMYLSSPWVFFFPSKRKLVVPKVYLYNWPRSISDSLEKDGPQGLEVCFGFGMSKIESWAFGNFRRCHQAIQINPMVFQRLLKSSFHQR